MLRMRRRVGWDWGWWELFCRGEEQSYTRVFQQPGKATAIYRLRPLPINAFDSAVCTNPGVASDQVKSVKFWLDYPKEFTTSCLTNKIYAESPSSQNFTPLTQPTSPPFTFAGYNNSFHSEFNSLYHSAQAQ